MAVAGRLAKPFAFLLLAAIACGESSTKSAKKRSVEEIEVLKDIKRPDFNSDSAYAYIEKQVSFGPRGQYQSILNGDGNPSNESNSFHIQNLYATYAATDKLSFTAGYMGTFIGYEVISPVGNFHYSTS